MPKITFPEPVQIAVIAVAGIVFVVVLILAIRRALRPKPSIPVDVSPPVTDPNTPPDAAPGGDVKTPSILDDAKPTVANVVERATPAAPASAAIQTSVVRVGKDGDTEFVMLSPHQLEKIAVVASAIDNQWESRKVLAQMRASFAQKPLGLADIREERRKAGRAEYVRALLNSEQLVANRVFLYNTDYIAEDYVQQGETRDAFIRLLDNGVIVPYLLTEHSPVEAPVNVQTAEAFKEWQRVSSEARMRAVRLDWDDALNNVESKKLSGRFVGWLGSLGTFDEHGDIDVLAKSLGVEKNRIPALVNRMLDVSIWINRQKQEHKEIKRGTFYEHFILASETKVTDGIIDFDHERRPFAAELKQLADLSYATNLPDALGRYALTPLDSLPRTALQELNITFGQQNRAITEATLDTLLQRETFALITEMEALSSMAYLSLSDVIALRGTDEWRGYIQEMQGLLDHPLEFSYRSRLVYDRYITLARLMTDRVKASGRLDALERWSPVVKLVLTVGASSLSLWSPFDTSPAGKILYNVTDGLIGQAANLTARMIIGGISDRRAEAELETSLDFMRGRLEGAQSAWSDILGRLRSDPRFQDVTGQADRSRDEFDPNINFQEDIVEIAS